MSLLLTLLALAQAAPGTPAGDTAAPVEPDAAIHCQPAQVAACRDTRVQCELVLAAADPAVTTPARWAFSDGGPPAEGARVTRTFSPGFTAYAVTVRFGAKGHERSTRMTLPLDLSSLAECTAAPAPRPALPAKGDGTVRVAVLSDSNGPYGAIPQVATAAPAVRALVEHVRPDVVVHNGDMIAAQKRGIGPDQLRAMWAEYLAVFRAPLAAAGIPLLPVAGNHDASPSKKLHDRAVYREVWSRPENRPAVELLPGGDYPSRYAAVVGGVTLLVLDAPTGRQSRADVKWAGDTLAGAPDGVRLAFTHVPPWQPTERRYGTLKRWTKLAPLLREGRVAALFSGHYELFYPTRQDGVDVVLDGTIATPCGRRADGADGCRCRPLTDTTSCQGASFVVFDIRDGEVVRRFAVHGPDFDRILPTAWLPESVGGNARAGDWL